MIYLANYSFPIRFLNRFSDIGIFPGTFDPVHYGHIEFADKVICSSNLSLVLFLPHIFSKRKTPSSLDSRISFLKSELKSSFCLGVLEIPVDIQNGFRDEDNNWVKNLVSYLQFYSPNSNFSRLFGSDRVSKIDTNLFVNNYCGTRGKSFLDYDRSSGIKFIFTPDISSSKIRNNS